MIVVPNDRLLQTEENLSMNDAFALADDVLKVGIQSIAELILVPGEINLDFADVKTIMENAGPAWMGIGESSGEGRAIDAAEKAVSSPLLELPIDGAKGVIFNVSGGQDTTLDEVTSASEVIKSKVHPEANIIFGSVTNPKLNGKIKITVIATGFDSNQIYSNDRNRARLSPQSLYEQSEGREAGASIPEFLRLRQNR